MTDQDDQFERAVRSSTIVPVADGFLVLSRHGLLTAVINADGEDVVLGFPGELRMVALHPPLDVTLEPESLCIDEESMQVLARTLDGASLVRWSVPPPEADGGVPVEVVPLEVGGALDVSRRRARRGRVVESYAHDLDDDPWDREAALELDLGDGLVVSAHGSCALDICWAGEPAARVDVGWYSRRQREFGPRILPDGDSVLTAVSTDKNIDHSWLVAMSVAELRRLGPDGDPSAIAAAGRRLYPFGDASEPDRKLAYDVRGANHFETLADIVAVNGNLDGDRIAVLSPRTVQLRTWPGFHLVATRQRPDLEWLAVSTDGFDAAVSCASWVSTTHLAVGHRHRPRPWGDDTAAGPGLALIDASDGIAERSPLPEEAVTLGRVGDRILAVLESGAVWERSPRHPQGRVLPAQLGAAPALAGITAAAAVGVIGTRRVVWAPLSAGEVLEIELPEDVVELRADGDLDHAAVRTADGRASTLRVTGGRLEREPVALSKHYSVGEHLEDWTIKAVAIDVVEGGLVAVDSVGELQFPHHWTIVGRGAVAISVPAEDTAGRLVVFDQEVVMHQGAGTGVIPRAVAEATLSPDGRFVACLVERDDTRVLRLFRRWGGGGS